MIISLSSQTFDPNGHIYLSYEATSKAKELKRRVSRTATMDGGCTFDDLGFTWTDSDLELKFPKLSKTQEAKLTYLVTNYGVLTASISDGVFDVLVDSYSFKQGDASVKLLIVGER